MKKDDSLGDLLKTWKPPLAIPRDFQSEVWDRIAIRAENRQTRWWNRAGHWLAEGWVRPRMAIPLAGAALLVALIAGQVQSQVASSHEWSRLGTRYALSIDPYAKAQMRQGP